MKKKDTNKNLILNKLPQTTFNTVKIRGKVIYF